MVPIKTVYVADRVEMGMFGDGNLSTDGWQMVAARSFHDD